MFLLHILHRPLDILTCGVGDRVVLGQPLAGKTLSKDCSPGGDLFTGALSFGEGGWGAGLSGEQGVPGAQQGNPWGFWYPRHSNYTIVEVFNRQRLELPTFSPRPAWARRQLG